MLQASQVEGVGVGGYKTKPPMTQDQSLAVVDAGIAGGNRRKGLS